MAAQLLVRHVQARGDFPGSEKGLSGLLVCGALAHLLPWFSVGADTLDRHTSLFRPVEAGTRFAGPRRVLNRLGCGGHGFTGTTSARIARYGAVQRFC